MKLLPCNLKQEIIQTTIVSTTTELSMKNSYYLLLLIIISGLIISSTIVQEKSVTESYLENYSNSFLKNVKKRCPLSCKTSSLSETNLEAAEKRINYFRNMVNLPPVRLDSSLNRKAQLAAFLMDKNNQISHHPNSSWKCITEDSEDAARHSNLRFFDSFDTSEKDKINPITGFIEDYGAQNNNVGHRRWILFSQLETVGYGATTKAEAIYIPKNIQQKRKNLPVFIAYPPKGEIIVDLLFPKWSFSIPKYNDVNFSNAKITVSDQNGKNFMVKSYTSDDKYGDPTLVWTPTSIYTGNSNNLKFSEKYIGTTISVLIKNVVINGDTSSFQYNVIPIKSP